MACLTYRVRELVTALSLADNFLDVFAVSNGDVLDGQVSRQANVVHNAESAKTRPCIRRLYACAYPCPR